MSSYIFVVQYAFSLIEIFGGYFVQIHHFQHRIRNSGVLRIVVLPEESTAHWFTSQTQYEVIYTTPMVC